MSECDKCEKCKYYKKDITWCLRFSHFVKPEQPKCNLYIERKEK